MKDLIEHIDLLLFTLHGELEKRAATLMAEKPVNRPYLAQTLIARNIADSMRTELQSMRHQLATTPFLSPTGRRLDQ